MENIMDLNKMPKQKVRDQLALDTARFLKAGGKIKQIPYGDGSRAALTKKQRMKFSKLFT